MKKTKNKISISDYFNAVKIEEKNNINKSGQFDLELKSNCDIHVKNNINIQHKELKTPHSINSPNSLNSIELISYPPTKKDGENENTVVFSFDQTFKEHTSDSVENDMNFVV